MGRRQSGFSQEIDFHIVDILARRNGMCVRRATIDNELKKRVKKYNKNKSKEEKEDKWTDRTLRNWLRNLKKSEIIVPCKTQGIDGYQLIPLNIREEKQETKRKLREKGKGIVSEILTRALKIQITNKSTIELNRINQYFSSSLWTMLRLACDLDALAGREALKTKPKIKVDSWVHDKEMDPLNHLSRAIHRWQVFSLKQIMDEPKLRNLVGSSIHRDMQRGGEHLDRLYVVIGRDTNYNLRPFLCISDRENKGKAHIKMLVMAAIGALYEISYDDSYPLKAIIDEVSL